MARKPKYDYDLIVIGSGAGGSPAASIAAQAGKKVAIVESDIFGGESPNWGDVPVKALLHAVQLYDEAKKVVVLGCAARRSATITLHSKPGKTWLSSALELLVTANTTKTKALTHTIQSRIFWHHKRLVLVANIFRLRNF